MRANRPLSSSSFSFPYSALHRQGQMIPSRGISHIPYLAKTFGSMPNASLIMIGVCGLFFFMVGYARDRNDLACLLVLRRLEGLRY